MIRPVTAADLDAVMAVEEACFGELGWSRAMVAEELDRPGGIFLVAGEPMAGFAIGWAVFDDLHVLQVATHPSHRRVGLGRLLLDALVAAAPRVTAGFLEVRADNGDAIAFYEAVGWLRLAVRPGYYADGCDALIYRISLPYQPSEPKRIVLEKVKSS